MNIIIGNAWPYANGPLHLGRIAVLLPGDIIARYHRMMGDNVVFLSGTDCHGAPVTMRAEEEGITPLKTALKYHEEFQKCFKCLDFSFDIFSKTHSKYHSDKVKEFILQLFNKGYIYEKNDESKHLYFCLSKFENDVKRLFEAREGWRENAEKIVNRYLSEGLRDRAVTRSFHWGIDVPLDGYEDKKIFVWIEAVMGYLTASMKFLDEKNEDWKEYWEGEDSRVYFVHGKDNIPFHTIIFPAILFGLGIKNPNIKIISSEYLKLEGKHFSSVKNWAIWADYIVNKYNVDSVRYYLALNSPETKDTDFTWRDFVGTVNNDLVKTLSGFVDKVLLFSKRNFNSRIPNGNISQEIKNEIFNLYFEVGDKIEEGQFHNALTEIFRFILKINKYFDEQNLGALIVSNKKECMNVLYTCIQVIINLSNLLCPFLPSTCEKIKKSFRYDKTIWSYFEKTEGKLDELDNLFEKIDRKSIQFEIKRLKSEKN